jgi:hypothetical protein
VLNFRKKITLRLNKEKLVEQFSHKSDESDVDELISYSFFFFVYVFVNLLTLSHTFPIAFEHNFGSTSTQVVAARNLLLIIYDLL